MVVEKSRGGGTSGEVTITGVGGGAKIPNKIPEQGMPPAPTETKTTDTSGNSSLIDDVDNKTLAIGALAVAGLVAYQGGVI